MYVAVIPARGGSKGIKDKNLQTVGGVSLVSLAIISAQKAGVDKIVVSTDSQVIEQEARKFDVLIHKRSQITSSDTAKTIDVVKELYHDLSLSEDDVCVLLQPTSPLRQVSDICQAIRQFEKNKFLGSVISVVETNHHPYKMLVETENDIVPLKDSSFFEMPRQSLPKVLRINGAVYIASFVELLNNNSFFVEPISYIEMNERDSIDIDSYADLELANYLMKEFQ